MKDYYQILQVSSDATQEKIRHQYLLLVRTWHPDKYTNQTQKARAEEKTKEINEAYGVLKDTSKRARYDRERRPKPSPSVVVPGAKPSSPGGSAGNVPDHLHYEFLASYGDLLMVALNHPANVILLDPYNYSRYRAGNLFNYIGGYAQISPLLLEVPYWGKWHLAIDHAGSKSAISASVSLIR